MVKRRNSSRQKRAFLPKTEGEEKAEIARQQIRDMTLKGEVLLWIFGQRKFVWVDALKALALCLDGRASIAERPGRRPACEERPTRRRYRVDRDDE